MTTNQNAMCLANTQETTNFQNYMNLCRTLDDTSRANNFFTNSIVNFKEQFQMLRGQYDNFLMAGNAQNSLMSLSGNSANEVKKQLASLENRKETLTQEIQQYRGQSEANDRMFLDTIMHGTPKKEMYSTLQDVSLGLFVLGWIVMGVVLVMVRWGSPGGTWQAGLFTFALLLVISLCVYALLFNVL